MQWRHESAILAFASVESEFGPQAFGDAEDKTMPFDGIGFATSDSRLNQIEEVIDLLATPDKWCKGALKTPDGRFCIRGALNAVHAINLQPVILQAINEVTGRKYRRIEAFNDDPDTTHHLVLRVLGRARDLIGQQAAIQSLPQRPNWRARLQEWVQSFGAEKAA